MDLFENEQKVFENITKRLEEVREGGFFSCEELEAFANEYGKLLRQLRKSIYFADRISNGLFKNNLTLDEKVHFDALTGIYNRLPI